MINKPNQMEKPFTIRRKHNLEMRMYLEDLESCETWLKEESAQKMKLKLELHEN